MENAGSSQPAGKAGANDGYEVARNAQRVIALEGCFINCASRMMHGVIVGLGAEVIVADRLYDFDRSKFGIEEMPAEQTEAHARTGAQKIAATL